MTVPNFSSSQEAYPCRVCGEGKPLTAFYDWGHDHICKGCCVARNRKYYAQRSEEQKERDLQRSREWNERNRDRKRKSASEWRARVLETTPERLMLIATRHRCRKEGIPFELTPQDIVIPAVCPVLGIPLVMGGAGVRQDGSPSIDRIDPQGGYVRGNVAVISWKANRLKSNATTREIEALAAWMKKVGAP